MPGSRKFWVRELHSREAVLEMWPPDQQHLGTCEKCKFLGLVSDLLNQKL